MAQASEENTWGALRAAPIEDFRWYRERQEEQTKNFLQDATDSLRRDIDAAETRLIVWLGFIVAIPAASIAVLGVRFGFALGAITVVLLTGVHALWRSRWLRTRANRLHGFRERFRRRAGDPFDLSWLEMQQEDRNFFEKCKDTILWPSVVAYERRDGRNRLDHADLEHLNTLIADHESGHSHVGPSESDKNCKLCTAANRVRENLEAALSAIESDLESSRQQLVAEPDTIDPELAFDKNFRSWMNWVSEETEEPSDSHSGRRKEKGAEPRLFLATVYEKNPWTFDEADKVREIARMAKEWHASDYSDDELREFSSRLFDELSRKMQDASIRFGLSDQWNRYDAMQNWLAEKRYVIEHVRNIIGRYHPDTMFRELSEMFGGIHVQLPGIEKWGYDPEMVQKQRKIARHFMAKNRDDWDREREQQLRAAQTAVLAESARGRYRCESAPSRKPW